MFLARAKQIAVSVCERRYLVSGVQNYRTNSKLLHSKARMDMDFNNKGAANLVTKEMGKLIKFDNIAKSQQDCREYRGLQLENGLKVLLISDETTDVAAAALAVEVGQMSDPDEVPGLAHFCEHMLFLGTEKYPSEDAYATFLTKNGGSSNAGTYTDLTKYYFDVAPDKLDGALDRFAQFFIKPLFTESATLREINAVHSEYEKNLIIDDWRLREVNKGLAKKNHPYHKFGAGNKDTLYTIPLEKQINIREKLMTFHKQWYSSNIMCLAVFGKESLDELQNMVMSKFLTIENKDIKLPIWDSQPFEKESYASKTYIIPIKDIRSLTISFTTEDLDAHYKSGPEHYLSHLIGYEGKGSLLSELRQRGWCNNLIAGHTNVTRGFGFFDVTVDLTQDGFENIDEVIHLIFQFIQLLRKEGPKKRIFDEYCNLSKMIFQFKDKEHPASLVSDVVHSMQLYPIEEVLTAPYLTSEWRPDLIDNLMERLVPENCRIVIVGQKTLDKDYKTEPWYKAKYYTEKISDELIKKWKNCELNENFTLPDPNPFIPTNFDLYPLDEDLSTHPTIIYDTPVIRVWHKQDNEFLKPKTCVNFDLSNPMVYSDPLNCNLTHIFVALFRDKLKEYLYDADLAGLKFKVANTTSGISIAILGYSHKLSIFLENILDQLFSLEIDEQRFDVLKEEHMRQLKNFKAEQPFHHAVYYLALILTEHAWSKGELLDAMKMVTMERVEHFKKEFLSRLHTECFIYGNANKDVALDISKVMELKLEKTNSVVLPLLARQLLQKREYKLCDGEMYQFESTSEFHKSSCAELYLQCGSHSDTSAVFIDLVAQILTDPCYDSLRTKEQLGYIVSCGSRKLNGATGIRFLVQSSKHPVYVEDRIENFLLKMEKRLEDMSEKEFEEHKQALATVKLEKPKKLSVKFYKYMNEISISQYHFERAESEVSILRKITKQELINYYKTYISKNSLARHALSIHIVSSVTSPDVPDENELSMNEIKPQVVDVDPTKISSFTPKRLIISDLTSFKSSKELYPVARPFLDIRPKGARSKL